MLSTAIALRFVPRTDQADLISDAKLGNNLDTVRRMLNASSRSVALALSLVSLWMGARSFVGVVLTLDKKASHFGMPVARVVR
jgi:hypothetical protein